MKSIQFNDLLKHRKKMRNPTWNEILYCHECGNTDVQVMAWVNANTDEYCSDVNTPPEIDDCWCDYCEAHRRLVTISELWNEFADHNQVYDPEGAIPSQFLLFPAGTPKTNVLQWFRERMPAGIFKNLTTQPPIQNPEIL